MVNEKLLMILKIEITPPQITMSTCVFEEGRKLCFIFLTNTYHRWP
jgi:hypothetical protein